MAKYKPKAIISVYDKTGIIELAKELYKLETQIIATSGTARYLQENSVPAITVAEYTGYPELMDGRLKTLHPKIHGGILVPRDDEKQMAEAKNNGIEPIDYVIVNTHPIRKATATSESTIESVVDMIDEGGLALIINGVRNSKHVITLTDPQDYGRVMIEIRRFGEIQRYPTSEELVLRATRILRDYFHEISDFISFRMDG
jgi:phosphoribosylaminoimidazolecarboxamide formyltransferase/IMP cyclohydrolase